MKKMNLEKLMNLVFSAEDVMDAVFNELHGINDIKQNKYERMFEIASCKDDRKKWGGKLLTLRTVREHIKDHVDFIRIHFVEPFAKMQRKIDERKK